MTSTSASATPPATAPPAPPAAVPFHRLARAHPHRSWWWRPLGSAAVAGAAYLVMFLQLLGLGLVLSVIVPGAEPSAELMDPLNPMDQLFMLGMLALMLPAVLIGTLAGYGRAGIAHSVRGRFRWRLAARAASVIVPLYLVVNIGVNLLIGRDLIVVPELGAGVLLAWGIALVLVPLQAAGEEYVFRVLPLQALGTWVRTPLLGIVLPIPLFVLGHGYAPLGQVDIALFALCMGLLAWKTGGIEIPVLLHVANNWTLFAIAPLVPGFLDQGEVTVPGFVLAIVPMLLCTAGVWWWISRREGLGLLEPVRGNARRDREHVAVRRPTGVQGVAALTAPPAPAAYSGEAMCRLFALRSDQPITADFWLLDAPYSLLSQSRFNADGTGLGWIDEHGAPRVAKKPVAAYASERFGQIATALRSRAMIAHVRLSSGTGHSEENTHPFLQDGILSAHNGVLEVTEEMKERVRELGADHHVLGTTDSEWMAALITGEVAAHGGDLRDGVVAALDWIARNVAVYSVNVLVLKGEEMIAVRLPATNELWVLEREATPAEPREALEQSSATLRTRSEDLAGVASVVIASEPMDEDPHWRLMDSGELLHISADGAMTSERPFGPLAQPLALEDLGLSAAASQAHAAQDQAQQERRRRLAERAA